MPATGRISAPRRLGMALIDDHPNPFEGKGGRGERIRTSGPCLPKTVLYQAELHSDWRAWYAVPGLLASPPVKIFDKPAKCKSPALAGLFRRFRNLDYRLASSAPMIASPISLVLIGVPPSGPSKSPVRAPWARTVSIAASRRSASAPWSYE